MKKHLFLFIISLLTFSCAVKEAKENISKSLVFRDGLYYADSTSTLPYTGRNKSKLRDQTIEFDVVNGIREGDFIVYYPNKNIQMIGKLTNNKNTGEWKYYNPNGSLQTVGKFLDDMPSGIWTWYYPDGKLAEEGNFVKGKKDGEWKTYDSLGNVKLVLKYKMNTVLDSIQVKK